MPGGGPFRILVLGATGLIGSTIAGHLQAEGHSVRGVARSVDSAARRLPRIDWQKADIAKMTAPEQWSALLADIDVVVNASGALQDGPNDNLRALQVEAMTALFDACAADGKQVIHISAAGVEGAAAPFMALKREADTYLQSLDCDWTILRPGLVLAPVAYGGSAMLRALAAMPFGIPLAFADRELRTVHVDDIAEAVSAALAGRIPARRTYDLVSSRRETFAEVVLAMRDWLGLRRVPIMHVPDWLARIAFRLGDAAGALGWTPPMRSASFTQMSQGVSGNPDLWTQSGGDPVPAVRETLQRIPCGVQEIWFARLWLLKPVILTTLTLFWILSGIIGLVRWQAAAAILDDGVLSGLPTIAFVLGGAVADIAVGAAIAARRTSRAGLLAALGLSACYLAGSALFSPALWADPLGPMLKVIPSLVLTLAALAILEDR